MTTSLTQKFLLGSGQDGAPASASSRSATGGKVSQLVEHLVNAVNGQIEADRDVAKFQIASDADVAKDANSQYYTLIGSCVGVFGS